MFARVIPAHLYRVLMALPVPPHLPKFRADIGIGLTHTRAGPDRPSGHQLGLGYRYPTSGLVTLYEGMAQHACIVDMMEGGDISSSPDFERTAHATSHA